MAPMFGEVMPITIKTKNTIPQLSECIMIQIIKIIFVKHYLCYYLKVLKNIFLCFSFHCIYLSNEIFIYSIDSITSINTSIFSNLILNPSFELSKEEPKTRLTSFNNFTCEFWNSPNLGTPDYYTSERIGDFSFSNLIGSQTPLHGKKYVGILIYSNGIYSEYLQVRLIKKLKSNKTYCLSIFTSLAENSSIAINEIDYIFKNKETHFPNNNSILTDKPNVIKSDSFFNNKSNWSELRSLYKADGTEEYLIIGVFKNKVLTTELIDKFSFKRVNGAYHYFDHLSLMEATDTVGCVPLPKNSSPNSFDLAIGKPFSLKNINFDSNRSQLIESSYPELNNLADYLKKNSIYTLEIFRPH